MSEAPPTPSEAAKESCPICRPLFPWAGGDCICKWISHGIKRERGRLAEKVRGMTGTAIAERNEACREVLALLGDPAEAGEVPVAKESGGEHPEPSPAEAPRECSRCHTVQALAARRCPCGGEWEQAEAPRAAPSALTMAVEHGIASYAREPFEAGILAERERAAQDAPCVVLPIWLRDKFNVPVYDVDEMQAALTRAGVAFKEAE